MTNKVDWSKAPEWADRFGVAKGIDSEAVFFNDKLYTYVDEIDDNGFHFDLWDNLKISEVSKIQFKPKQITEIRAGDYIHKDELDTEEKFNDVVRVFKQFGCRWGKNACKDFKEMGSDNILIWSAGLNQGAEWHKLKKRQLTYKQIMALDSNNPEFPDGWDETPIKMAELKPVKSRPMTNREVCKLLKDIFGEPEDSLVFKVEINGKDVITFDENEDEAFAIAFHRYPGKKTCNND